MSKSLSIESFKFAAQAALDEVELNALKGRDNTTMQESLWEHFDILEQIAKEANTPAEKLADEGEVAE